MRRGTTTAPRSRRRSGTSAPPRPVPVPTCRATVAYDGTDFYGWARQPDRRTVEGVIGEAVGAPLAVAGRTDRGVHAAANVVSFDLPAEPPLGKLNSGLPEDVSVLDVAQADEGFDAR